MWRWIRRVLLGIGALILATIIAVIGWNWDYAVAFPGILSSFTAKEYCTCRYVIGRDDEACRQYAEYFIPISELRFDDEARTVEVDALLHTNSARFISERYGCELD